MANFTYIGYTSYGMFAMEPAGALQRLRTSFTRTPVLFSVNALVESRESLMPRQSLEERRAKKKIYDIAYRANNRERIRSNSARYVGKYPERVARTKAKYRAENNDKILKYNKEYRDSHKEEIRRYQASRLARRRQRWAETRERQLALKRIYRARHLIAIRLRDRIYSAAHRQEAYKRVKQWTLANPEKVLARQRSRRASKANAPVNDLTSEQWLEILDVFDHRCAYCQRKMKRLTQDHIQALSKDGSHTVQNIVPCCTSCNSKKGIGPPLVPVQPLLLTIAAPKKAKA